MFSYNCDILYEDLLQKLGSCEVTLVIGVSNQEKARVLSFHSVLLAVCQCTYQETAPRCHAMVL